MNYEDLFKYVIIGKPRQIGKSLSLFQQNIMLFEWQKMVKMSLEWQKKQEKIESRAKKLKRIINDQIE